MEKEHTNALTHGVPKELAATRPKLVQPGTTDAVFQGHPDEARLVVVEQVSHHRKDESEPYVFLSRYSKFLNDKREQTFDREPPSGVGEEWTPITKFGSWIEKCSQLLIENKESVTSSNVNLSEEQKEEIESRVIEVKFGIDGTPVEIPASESMRVRPTNLADTFMRCRKGTAMFRIGIIPL